MVLLSWPTLFQISTLNKWYHHSSGATLSIIVIRSIKCQLLLHFDRHLTLPLISGLGTYMHTRVSHRCWEHDGGGGGGGSSKFDGWGLSQNMRGVLKMLSKNEGVHLIVKLPAISLQAFKFTKNEILHTYFSRILARF